MDDGKFSRYEIRGLLGAGGMAEVYRAYDPYSDREVALKILRREMLEDARLRERFERETKIIAKLELEAIVPVYDIGRDKDQSFFVMRLMTGGKHILLVFQDVRLAPNSKNQLYYIPIDQIGTATSFTPIPLPRLFFQNLDENIQLTLHPSIP